jgi:exopolysaccharide biosynthesis polyprenyl glycosylphosphotransferase
VDDSTTTDTLGSATDLPRLIDRHQIDDIVIALPGEAYQTLHTIIADLQKTPVHISVVQDFVSLALHRAKAELLGELPVISLRASALGGYQRLVKRIFDIAVTVPLLILTAPVMLVVGVLVKLQSPGPAIFSQQRAGENGRLFTMYKFRTMIDGAEETSIPDKGRGDSRVTLVGRVLRRFSLDELPQLWNVLKGDMSLVGPRPEVARKMDNYQAWQRKRLAVPPGMTGWWQVTGRGEKPLHLHTEDDLYYITHYSILLDVQILLRTVVTVLSGRGAF